VCESIKGGLLNKPVQKRVDKTDAQRWAELIAELEGLAKVEHFDESLAAMCIPKIGALNLIQPFNWPEWQEPFPEATQVKLMDLETAVKHITRICRTERFHQNFIWGPIKSGLLLGLCLVVREHTRGEIVRNVFENTN
jgi:hypothetical protein